MSSRAPSPARLARAGATSLALALVACLALAATGHAATRYSANAPAVASNGMSQYVIGYLLPAGTAGHGVTDTIDVQTTRVDSAGRTFGYGRISSGAALPAGWDTSRCGWVELTHTTPGATVSTGCPAPPAGSILIPPSSLFQAGTYQDGCGDGCLQAASIQSLCPDLTAYANYDPATHAFSNPSFAETPGRTVQGTRYRTIDGYAVMVKDTLPGTTAWGFMKSECVKGLIQAWDAESLNRAPTSGMGVASWGTGRLDLFYRGAGNALMHDYYGGGAWGGTDNLGGSLGSDPDAVSWGSGRIDMVYTGTDHVVYHMWYGGAFGGPQAIPGGAVGDSAPAIAAWAPGRLDAFVKAANGNLLHAYNANGVWSSWENLGGSYVSGPAATAWGSGRLDVVIRNTSGTLTHVYYAGGWGADDLGSPPGGMTYDPAIATYGVNDLNITVAAPDGSVRQKLFTAGNGWGGWGNAGGYTRSSPAAVSWGFNRTDVFWVDGPGHVLHSWMAY